MNGWLITLCILGGIEFIAGLIMLDDRSLRLTTVRQRGINNIITSVVLAVLIAGSHGVFS